MDLSSRSLWVRLTHSTLFLLTKQGKPPTTPEDNPKEITKTMGSVMEAIRIGKRGKSRDGGVERRGQYDQDPMVAVGLEPSPLTIHNVASGRIGISVGAGRPTRKRRTRKYSPYTSELGVPTYLRWAAPCSPRSLHQYRYPTRRQ